MANDALFFWKRLFFDFMRSVCVICVSKGLCTSTALQSQACIQRVRNVVRSRVSQEKAASIARSYQKKRKQCVQNKGRAIKG